MEHYKQHYVEGNEHLKKVEHEYILEKKIDTMRCYVREMDNLHTRKPWVDVCNRNATSTSLLCKQ